MADVKSLSAKQITDAARASAAKLLAGHKTLGPGGGTIGYVPKYHWIGLILREDIDKIGEAKKLAADMQQAIVAGVPSLKGGTPGAVIQGGHIILGFVPPHEIDVIAE